MNRFKLKILSNLLSINKMECERVPNKNVGRGEAYYEGNIAVRELNLYSFAKRYIPFILYHVI